MSQIANSLSERIADALGWPVSDVHSFSYQALRDLVRPVDSKLADEISYFIQSGLYIIGKEYNK